MQALPRKLQQPLTADQVQWDLVPQDGYLCGTLYADGSAIHGECRSARRGGWGISMIEGDGGRIDGAAFGPLPTFTQTAASAEVYAAYMALRLSKPPIIIATD